MNVLILTPQLPYPARQGTTLRNYNIIRYLAREHTVDLLTFLAPDDRITDHMAGAGPLTSICRTVEAVPQPHRSLRGRAWTTVTSPLPDMALRLHSEAMTRKLDALLAATEYDLVQIEGIEMAAYGLRARGRCGCGCAVLFDDHNCEYLLQYRNALTDLRTPRRWVAGLYSVIQWRKLLAYERAVMRRADATAAVSEPDRAALARIAPDAEIEVIPNGADMTDFPDFARARPEGANLVFTGKMDYRPNVDAALWFADEVLPIILEREPQALFRVVGMNPHKRLETLRGRQGIEITGFVEEVRPYLEQCAVYVLPLRVGGGTRFKALEAMGSGLPVVSTSLGVEGLGTVDGIHLLMADSAQAFAEAVLKCLADRKNDNALCHALGAQARRFVGDHYSWDRILPAFDNLFARLRAGVAPTLEIDP